MDLTEVIEAEIRRADKSIQVKCWKELNGGSNWHKVVPRISTDFKTGTPPIIIGSQ